MRQFVLRDDSIRSNFVRWLMGQSLEKPLAVNVEPFKKKRSVPSNRRLWLLHGMAAEVVGDSPDSLHEDCCCDYFGFETIKLPSGVTKRKPNRTTTTPDVLPQDKFNLFQTWVEQRYIDMLGVWLGKDDE